MKIFLLHNYYLHPGGEDIAFRNEILLLRKKRHQVIALIAYNKTIIKVKKIKLIISTIWSKQWYKIIQQQIIDLNPQLVHFHNTFPLISPAAYYACRKLNVPVVQTLHNYRLICPAGTLFRDGQICEQCLGLKFPWPAVINKCYHSSAAQSLVIALMLFLHKTLNTYEKQVDLFLCLSEFSKKKFIEAGFQANKLCVKRNFITKDNYQQSEERKHFLFIGRLSAEKGIRILLEAMDSLDCSLMIAGSGPLEPEIALKVANQMNVTLLGNIQHEDVFRYLSKAIAVILPSTCYENMPFAIIEAYSCGVPVIASRLGAMAEIVQDGKTGLLFHPGDAIDLAVKINWASKHPEELATMGKAAYGEYMEKYTAEKNYQILMGIYEKAITTHRKSNNC